MEKIENMENMQKTGLDKIRSEPNEGDAGAINGNELDQTRDTATANLI